METNGKHSGSRYVPILSDKAIQSWRIYAVSQTELHGIGVHTGTYEQVNDLAWQVILFKGWECVPLLRLGKVSR